MAGKRHRRVLLAANNTPLISIAACSPIWGKMDFIIDTGAAVSILPICLAEKLVLEETPTRLTNANGTPISVAGETSVEFSIRSLNRSFSWKFIVCHTQHALIGIDFLNFYGLMIDCGNNSIIDSETKRTTGTTVFGPINTVVLEKIDGPAGAILEKYPNLTKPRNPLIDKPINNPVQHCIDTGSHLPVYSRPRRLNEENEKEAKEDFKTMMKNGIIRPSKSPWASPLHRVPKGEGKRNTGDYRNLNNVTTPDRYPVPSIYAVTSKLRGKKVYSKIDLMAAYHQIDMRPEDIPKTAINTPFGLFEYLKMPYGLKGAGSTFQRYMDNIFRDIDYIFVYFDDILIFSDDEESHKRDLENVLKILDEHNLKISTHKCDFFKDSVNFLGYEISQHGMKPTEEKRKHILNFPEPNDAKSLRSFLGLINFYRRLIKDFAEKILPLTELMRLNQKAKELKFNEKEREAFQNIKNELANLSTLVHPCNRTTQYQLITDSSNYAVGAVLHQMIEGEPVPIGFFSKKLSAPEQKYSAFDRELVAAYRAVLYFRPFIEGRDVTVFTDHKPLVSAFKSPNQAKSDRQQRHLTIIAEYINDISHIKGAQNVVADCLSRPVNAVTLDTYDLPGLARLQINDSETKKARTDNQLREFKLDNDLSLWCDISTGIPRPFVPKEVRRAIFEELHSTNHPGINSTLKLIKDRYYWPRMNLEIREWCKTCIPCQKSKITRHTKSDVSHFKITGDRFEIVHIDIVGPLPVTYEYNNAYSSQKRYILTCIDRATRWPEAIPIDNVEASTIAVAFMESWITRFGVPLYVITDRGSQFEAELFSELSKLTGFHRIRTTAYHAQSNGMLERIHRTIKTALKAKEITWIRALPMILFGLRMTPNENGYSPFTAVTGSYMNIPRILTGKDENPSGELNETQIKELIRCMRSINFQELSQGIHHGKAKSYVPKELQTCTHVWVRIDRVRKPLEAPYNGPFKVIKRDDKVFTILNQKQQESNVSIDRLKPAFIRVPITTEGERTQENRPQTTIPENYERTQENCPQTTTQDNFNGTNENTNQRKTRSGRKVTFQGNPDMVYLY